MGAVKEFFLSKLVLRLLYIAAAFSTSHIVGLAASPKVTTFLANAGILFKVTDPMALKTYITAMMLAGGEVAYHYFHEKVIIPRVDPALNPPKA